LGQELWIDGVVLRALGHDSRGRAGSMAPATAVGLCLSGTALLVLDIAPRARLRPAEVFAAGAATVGMIALLGYVFAVQELYRFAPFSSVALHTAGLLTMLGVGILISRADKGACAVITSALAGGMMARRLLLAAVAVPIGLGSAVLLGEWAGLYGLEVAIVLLTVSCVVVFAAAAVWTAASLNRADAARRRVEFRQSAMMQELDHRVKNNLAAVLSLADVSLRSAPSLADFRESFLGRIRAMARTHKALALGRWEGMRLREVVRLTVGPFAQEGRLDTEGDDVHLPARASAPICVALHELATNAAKYGAFSTTEGRVRIAWVVGPNAALTLEWSESGVPGIVPPRSTGFGTELIRGAVTHELLGQVDMRYQPPGFACIIRAPLSLLNESSVTEFE